MPARRSQGPHRHGYSASPECPDDLCRAFWRGYMRGYRRIRREGRTRNAEAIAALRRPDTEPGPVTRRHA